MKAIMIVIIAALSLCLALGSCHGKRTSDYRLKMADAIMNNTPDSALALLKTINRDSLDEELQAWHALLYTKATDKCYRPISDDSLISRAVDYYTDRGDSLEVQSLFYQGYYYSTHKVADTALVVLSRAYETALSAHDCFYGGMSAREISNVYRRLLMISEGLKWARIAKQLFIQARKPVHTAWMDHLIADGLTFTGNFDAARELLDSLTRSDFHKNIAFRRRTFLNLIELDLQLKSYEEVLTWYESLAQDQYRFTAHDRLNQVKASLGVGRHKSAENYLSVPRIVTMLIPKELIGAVIGPGGKVIQGIQEASGATVSIDEIDEGGYIEVAAANKAAIDKALEMVNAIVELPEEGKTYTGKVRSILEFGAFVEFMPNRDGLLHISEISWNRLENMEASGLKEGDTVEVKLIEIDKKTGKYRLSMRALQPKPEGYVERERAPRGDRPRREGGDRPRREDGDRPRREGGDRGPRGPRR